MKVYQRKINGSFASNPLRKLSPSFSLEIVSHFFSQRIFSLKYSLWIFFRIFLRRFSFDYSFTDYPSNIVSRIFFRIFFCGFSFKYCFADFLSNILSRIKFFRGFSFEYSFSDILSNLVMRDHIKNQLTGVLSDGTDTQGFTKSNESLVYFL